MNNYLSKDEQDERCEGGLEFRICQNPSALSWTVFTLYAEALSTVRLNVALLFSGARRQSCWAEIIHFASQKSNEDEESGSTDRYKQVSCPPLRLEHGPQTVVTKVIRKWILKLTNLLMSQPSETLPGRSPSHLDFLYLHRLQATSNFCRLTLGALSQTGSYDVILVICRW